MCTKLIYSGTHQIVISSNLKPPKLSLICSTIGSVWKGLWSRKLIYKNMIDWISLCLCLCLFIFFYFFFKILKQLSNFWLATTYNHKYPIPAQLLIVSVEFLKLLVTSIYCLVCCVIIIHINYKKPLHPLSLYPPLNKSLMQ